MASQTGARVDKHSMDSGPFIARAVGALAVVTMSLMEAEVRGQERVVGYLEMQTRRESREGGGDALGREHQRVVIRERGAVAPAQPHHEADHHDDEDQVEDRDADRVADAPRTLEDPADAEHRPADELVALTLGRCHETSLADRGG